MEFLTEAEPMLNLNPEQLQQHATPFYVYDLNLLHQTLQLAQQEANKYNFHVHYALKANANAPILDAMREVGFGADCVSGNEVKAAIENGFAPKDVVFAGVGKSDAEINFALEQEIFCFNCESSHELEVLNELAEKKNTVARVALRINPNVNANTHKYITTGLEENKFGINAWELESVLELLQKLKHVKLIGIHFHIGSQITDLTVFKNLCTRVNEFQEWFVAHHISLEHVNVGGGLGVDYYTPEQNLIPDFAAYFGLFNQFLELQGAAGTF
ncbi:type III PLP-dependent enzyme domain-containing protein [Pontibacter rugosus]